jgi:hypothetical protein
MNQTYDDGSYLVDDGSGGTIAVNTDGVAVSSVDKYNAISYVPGFESDVREQSKLATFYPTNGKPWWENAAAVGLTRAIDAAFGPAAVDKTTAAGYYAGANGKTYSTAPGQQAGAMQSGGVDLMTLLLIGGAAFFLMA